MFINYIRPEIERISANSYRVIGLCDLWHNSERVCRDYAIENWYSQGGFAEHVVYRFNFKALDIKYELHDLRFSPHPLVYLLNHERSKHMIYNAGCVMHDKAGFPNVYRCNYGGDGSKLTDFLIDWNENNCLKRVPFYDEVSGLYYDVPLETFFGIDNLKSFVDEKQWQQYYDFFKGEYKLNLKKCTNTDIAVAIFNRRAQGRWSYRKKDNYGRYVY